MVRLPVAFVARAVPHHFLWPCAVPEGVSTVEGVDWHILPHFVCIVAKERLPTAEQHLVLEVDDGDAVPVRPADDGVEVLKLGGQECSEGSLQAYGAGLLEAQEVCPANSSHVTSLRGVQGDEM